MSESHEINIADGLKEQKVLAKKMTVTARNLRRYSSKKKGQPDLIEKQKEYVRSERQKYEDLLKNWTAIKLAIQRANLDTYIEYKEIKMNLAEAIIWKQGRKETESLLWNSFTSEAADEQIGQAKMVAEKLGLTEAQMVEVNIVPELYYDEREIQSKKESLLEFEGRVDALIDAANIRTVLKL
jgi:hypothetical protein